MFGGTPPPIRDPSFENVLEGALSPRYAASPSTLCCLHVEVRSSGSGQDTADVLRVEELFWRNHPIARHRHPPSRLAIAAYGSTKLQNLGGTGLN